MDVTGTPLSVTALPELAVAKFSDTVEIDHEAHLLYIGDNWSGGLDVFDISTEQPLYLRTIRLPGRVYGIGLARNVHKIYVGLTGSSIAIIDSNPASAAVNTVVARIQTGGLGHADLMDYAPDRKRLFVANRNDGFMVSIDTTTDTIVGRVEGLGGGLEQPRFNPTDGMVYLTGNRENVLYRIDATTCELMEVLEIPDPCYPNGMAINPATNQALLACSNRERPRTVVWDLNKQQIAAVFEESGCGDGAMYEPTIDRFFFAADGFAQGPVVGIFGGNPVQFLTNVPTMKGASWVAYDRTNELVYSPGIVDGRPCLLSFRVPVS